MSRRLPILAGIFILCYFLLFTYHSLWTRLSFDDGMNFITMHRMWEVSVWRNVADCFQIFTAEPRPLGALFYKPLYALFGFNPLPYRIVIYAFLMGNIVLTYFFARALGAGREASAIATLLFSYNASMNDLYCNTGTVYDVLCFTLVFGALVVYMRQGNLVVVAILSVAALDAKEVAVILPAALLLYAVMYRRPLRLKSAGGIAVIGVFAALFLFFKVRQLSGNQFYQTHVSVGFVLKGIGHYFEQLFYLKPESFGATAAVITIAALLGIALWLKNSAAIYGVLFFVMGLLPVAAIQPRSGYAAYIAYPGLTVALGVMLARGRETFLKTQVAAVALFLLVAAVSIKSFAHERKVLMTNALWSESRITVFLDELHRRVPEVRPRTRMLVLDDPWGSDWGPMFLTRLMYHAPDLWMDRVHNTDKPDAPETYDYLITYKQPLIDMKPARFFGLFKMNWEVRAIPRKEFTFEVQARRN